MEYCSTVPVAEQVRAAGAVPTPSVMVPVSVLKRQSVPNTASGINIGCTLPDFHNRGALWEL